MSRAVSRAVSRAALSVAAVSGFPGPSVLLEQSHRELCSWAVGTRFHTHEIHERPHSLSSSSDPFLVASQPLLCAELRKSAGLCPLHPASTVALPLC